MSSADECECRPVGTDSKRTAYSIRDGGVLYATRNRFTRAKVLIDLVKLAVLRRGAYTILGISFCSFFGFLERGLIT
jgi:hypothetical protein